MNTTVRIRASQIYKDWRVIDAAGRSLGRVASEAAILLRGKHKPTYEPHLDDGDFVIIVNAAQVKVTGRKAEQIKYHTHSGYPGGLRTRSFERQFARFPDRVVEAAVKGMLPGGPLGEAMGRHLKVYAGPTHPHQSQISGSQKAQSVRAALAADIAEATTKPPRLRPLSVPDVAVVPAMRVAPAPPPKPVRARAPKVEQTPVTEAPAAESTPAVEVAKPAARRTKAPSGAAATAAEAAKAAAPAKKTAAKAVKPATDAPKPARKKAAEAESPATNAPKARATRKKAEPAAETSAVEEKKPARRRTATAKTEE